MIVLLRHDRAKAGDPTSGTAAGMRADIPANKPFRTIKLFTRCLRGLHIFLTFPCHSVARMKPSAAIGKYWKPVQATLAQMARLILLALTAGGCVSGRPWVVRIESPSKAIESDGNGADATRLSVTTFNVWGLPAWINGASPSRHARIARALEDLGSDVVLLQEVWTRQSYEILSQQAKGEARTRWTAGARRKGGFIGQNGLLTLSRYPIAAAEFRAFTAASLPDSLMRKGALKVTLELFPTQRVNVWNVHLQDGSSNLIRSRQIAQLVQWIDEADDGQVADIVGGDFNFTPGSREFRRFAAAVGFSAYQLASTDPLPTWDGLKAAPSAGETLDHIFVKPRGASEKVAAQARRLFCAARRADRLSDHMAVEALLTLRAADVNPLPVRSWNRPVPELAGAAAVGP